MKEEINKSIFFSGIFILSFILFNIIIATTEFIFKLSIFSFNSILALILSIGLILFLLKYNGLLAKKKIYNILISIFLSIFIIISAIFINGKILDFSHDGNVYHKATIGLIKEGWNPLYQTAEEFDNQQKEKIFIDESANKLWVNHYARASHIYQANIYKITGNIECGKSINTLSIIATFLILFSLLMQKLKKIVFPFIFSLIAVSSSVVCVQFLTNYIDLLVYLYLVLLLASFYIIGFKKDKSELINGYILFVISLIMMINIKFTSFAYAGIYCLAFYIYYIIKVVRKKLDFKFVKNFTIISAICVIVGVFVVGLAVYPKNLMTNGHPFYPLFGKDKVDIITRNQPDSFKKRSPISKFLLSTFSEADNIIAADKKDPKLKVPFTFTQKEYEIIRTTDTRISGHGVIFGGIFALALLIFVYVSFLMFKKDKKLFIFGNIIMGTTFLLAIGLGESWWARYFPQLYFIILIDILYLYILKNKVNILLASLLIILTLINNSISFASALEYSYDLNLNTKIYHHNLKTGINKDKDTIEITSPIFLGTIYNIKDEFKDYHLVITNEDKENFSDTFMSGLVNFRLKDKVDNK